MKPPRNQRRYLFPYLLLGLIASALVLLLMLDRRTPLFATPAGMVPFFFIIFAIAVVLGLFTTRTTTPSDNHNDATLWLKWHRSGPIGGALTGLLFLSVYWAYDWPAPNRTEVSERQVNQLCHITPPVPAEQIIWTTPNPADLVIEFALIGMVLGTVVSIAFPRWRRSLQRLTRNRGRLKVVTHPYPSGLLFGLVFGALIGAWLCPLIFSVSDGRPFIRVSTAAISVFLAVGLYLLFEVAACRHHMNRAAYATLTSVFTIAALLATLVWLLDAQLDISITAYCFFYDTWNSHANELTPGWRPAIAGALYGAMIGAITMSMTAGYMIVRTTTHALQQVDEQK